MLQRVFWGALRGFQGLGCSASQRRANRSTGGGGGIFDPRGGRFRHSRRRSGGGGAPSRRRGVGEQCFCSRCDEGACAIDKAVRGQSDSHRIRGGRCVSRSAPPREGSVNRQEKAKSRGVSQVNVRSKGAPAQMAHRNNNLHSCKRPAPGGEGQGGGGGIRRLPASGSKPSRGRVRWVCVGRKRAEHLTTAAPRMAGGCGGTGRQWLPRLVKDHSSH